MLARLACSLACALLAITDARAEPDFLDPAKVKAGQVGRLRKDSRYVWKFTIVQVIDGTNMLVRQPGETDFYWVQGVSTDGLVDGKDVTLDDHVFTVKTKQYTTALGTTKTVFMFAVESSTEREARLKEEARIAELRKFIAVQEAKRAAELEAERKVAAEKAAKEAAAAELVREAERKETASAAKLKLIKDHIERRNYDVARQRLKELIRDYPNAKATDEAKELLKKLQ